MCIRDSHNTLCKQELEQNDFRNQSHEEGLSFSEQPFVQATMKTNLKRETKDLMNIPASAFGVRRIIKMCIRDSMCFTCITDKGIEFKAKPMGNRELKQQYRENLDNLIGKKAKKGSHQSIALMG